MCPPGGGGVHGDTCGTLVNAVEGRLWDEGSGGGMWVGGVEVVCVQPNATFWGAGVSL